MSGIHSYEQAMNLVREQISALQEYKTLLDKCQAENEKLIQGMKFYANRQNWRSRLAHLDAGEKAREILKEVTGE